MKNKTYLEFLAVFMIAIIVTIPFYISDVFAQVGNNPFENADYLREITGAQTAGTQIDDPVEDPAQACIRKNEKTSDLVDLMDNDIIKVLEKIASVMHAISAAWTAAKAILDAYILILAAFYPTYLEAEELNQYRQWMDCPLCGTGFWGALVQYMATCEIPTTPFSEGGKGNVGLGLCKLADDVGGKIGVPIAIGAKDSIYTSIACACIPGILYNLRKLKTIYQTYNCCVKEACSNGLSTESCDRQFSQEQCMLFGKGAMYQAIVGIVISAISVLLMEHIIKKIMVSWGEKWEAVIGATLDLAQKPSEFKALMNGLKWIQESFSEPDCSDLGFDEIKDRREDEFLNKNCQYREVDIDGDGIYDILDYVCA
jgi:hypothetical protein|tara:strand:+ start:413 stop:1522 length:1110 start_codon:yes stop_codon:yes gene_type:complete